MLSFHNVYIIHNKFFWLASFVGVVIVKMLIFIFFALQISMTSTNVVILYVRDLS